MAKYNPENHSPNPAEFQRLIETSRTLAQAGNPKAAMDAARDATFFASNQAEVDQANGEASVHSNAWASQRNERRGERKNNKNNIQQNRGQVTTETPPATGSLTVNEEIMDTNNDGRVSRKERREFRRQAPETVAGKWGIAYALITQLRESPDPDARSFVRWFDGKVDEYRANPTGFSDEAFVIQFNQQPWAQKNKSSVIEDMNFEAQFPDLYRQQLDAEVEVLRDEAVQFGAAVTDDDLRELAKQRRRFGLNESQMRNSLANLATVKGGALAGQAGSLQAGLKDWARRNGVALTDNSINNYVRRIQSGDTTQADVLQDLRRTYLSGAYPGWADRIEAGQDIADIAEPYRQTMARILELPEDQVDLNDSLLRRGLQSVGPDGKPRVMPLYEFEQEIRKDPRWEFTENAYDVYSRVGTNLLRTFGFR